MSKDWPFIKQLQPETLGTRLAVSPATGANRLIAVKRSVSTLFTAVAVLMTLHLVPQASAQTDIVDRVLDRYSSLETLQARFTQTMTSDIFDEDERIRGSIFMRGEAYRILTGTRTIVTDGTTSWIFDAFEKQVLIDNQIEDESTFSVHEFLYAFDERFSVEGSQRSGDLWRIALTPIDPDDYFQHLELLVRDSDAIIVGLDVDDANEVHLEIRLSEISENPDIEDRMFSFDIPDGADVVDLRVN